jgi:hypothetical protein
LSETGQVGINNSQLKLQIYHLSCSDDDLDGVLFCFLAK